MSLNASLMSINTWQSNISIYIRQVQVIDYFEIKTPVTATGNHPIISPSSLKKIMFVIISMRHLYLHLKKKLNSLKKKTKSKSNIFLNYLSHLISRHISRHVDKIYFYINLTYFLSNPKVFY